MSETRWEQAGTRVAGWLRLPRVRRGLLVTSFLVACFLWAIVVMGMSVAMVEHGARQWWLVLVFGLLVLVVAVAAAYGALVTISRADRERGAERDPRLAPSVAARSAGTGETPGQPGPPPAKAGQPIESLSRRELAVLEQLAAGRSNREIANALYIAPGTVKAHLNHIFHKLGATSRLQAVARAREAGLLDTQEQK